MPFRLRALVPAGLAVIAAAPLAAQSAPRPPASAAVRRAVETITESDVRTRIAVIAADSMRGRLTPSPELEQTAAYIAAEFQRFGLRPGGDSGSYLQRYRIQRTQVDSTSFVMMMGRGAMQRWTVGQDAGVGGTLPLTDGAVTAPVVLLVGMPSDTARPFGAVDVRGAIVVQSLPAAPRLRGGPQAALIAKGVAAGVRGWVFLVNVSSAALATQARNALRPQLAVGGPAAGGPAQLPILLVRDSSAIDVLRAAGEDLAALRDTTSGAVRAMNGVTFTISARRRVLAEESAPNVVGILEGSDPQLRDEHVVFSAHMDHTGVAGAGSCSAVGADSICNGADDNASGTVGVVELAEAFATLTPHPRRSLIFLAVSGEERGLWGSGFYAEHPAAPLAQTVADLNMDMIGRNWRDTIVVIGKEHSTLGEVANRVTRQHPELGMQLIDDIWPAQNFYTRSDHFNFARRGVPILFFFNGVHPDYHRPTDSPDRIDAEKEARIVRMVFYIGLEVANATARPQWNPESRRQIVADGGN